MTAHAHNGMHGRLLLKIFGALTISLLSGELLGVNRFLRTVVEGRGFWFYMGVLLIALGVLLVTAQRVWSGFLADRLTRELPAGFLLGVVASVVAIAVSPLFLGGTVSTLISVLKDPVHLMAAAFLGMGWVYGVLAELTLHLLNQHRYWGIGFLIFGCLAIRLIGMVPLEL